MYVYLLRYSVIITFIVQKRDMILMHKLFVKNRPLPVQYSVTQINHFLGHVSIFITSNFVIPLLRCWYPINFPVLFSEFPSCTGFVSFQTHVDLLKNPNERFSSPKVVQCAIMCSAFHCCIQNINYNHVHSTNTIYRPKCQDLI